MLDVGSNTRRLSLIWNETTDDYILFYISNETKVDLAAERYRGVTSST